MFLHESIAFLACPAVNDVEKAIEDSTLATNSSFSIYKTEHGFNAKSIHKFVSFASYIFCTISIFFRY